MKTHLKESSHYMKVTKLGKAVHVGEGVDLTVKFSRDGPLIEQNIGRWRQDEGLMVQEPDMWQRRSNLHGVNVRFTSIHYPVLNTEFIYDERQNIIDAKGYLIDMLNMLKRSCNFTSTINYSIDGKFGGKNDDGSWNGMVGMVTRDEADVILSTLTISKSRKTVIDYTIPLFWEYMTLIAPRGQKLQLNYLVYLEIFPMYAHGILFTGVLSFASIFFLISQSGIDSLHRKPDSEQFGFTNGIGLSMMFLMQLTYKISTKAMSTRVIFFTSSISLFIIYSYFACDLTARMTAGPAAIPIQNFQDVLEEGYQVVVNPGTSQHRVLKDSEPGTPMHKVYYGTMHDEPKQFVQRQDALARIANTPMTLYWAPKMHIIGKGQLYEALKIDEQRTSMTGRPKCVPEFLNWFFYFNVPGWGISKNSEFTGLLNHWLQKFDETGLKERLWKRWTYKGNEEFGVDEATDLGFENIIFPFVLIAVGFVGATIFLIFEISA